MVKPRVLCLKLYLAFFMASTAAFLVCGQDQRIADDLKVIYDQDKLEGEEQLELLRDLAFHENRDYLQRQNYAKELIQLAEQANNPEYIYSGYLQLGNSLRLSGDITTAINAYFKSLAVARETGNEEREGHSLMTIGDTYSSIEDRENAITYYTNALELLRKVMDKANTGIVLFNLGDELIKLEQFDEATRYLDEAETIFKEEELAVGLLYVKGNRGVITGKTGNPELGITELLSTIEKLKEYEDYYAASSYMIYLAGIYADNNNLQKAIAIGEDALAMAADKNLNIQIRDANYTLYNIYSQAGFNDKSLVAFQNYYVYRDSIYNIESVEEMATLRYNADMAHKQSEVDSQRIILWTTGLVAVLLSLLAFMFYRRGKFIQRTNKIIEKEQARSEELLLNILPDQTAKELKEKGKVTAKKFESVSVLFTDFVNFTHYAEELEPEELVQSMDFYYAHFDTIMDRYDLEKIKTVGDSYMCAGGLPFEDPEHAVKIVNAAREIVEFVEQVKKDRSENEVRFDIRIGINSGPIVAGVVGTKKFAYDIWGDTVNVASRMESNSEPGKINISENTFEMVEEMFDCEHRGEISAKNRGKLKMFYVNGLKSQDTLKKGKQSVRV